MERFSEFTRRWFAGTLGEPTDVQKEAWPAIASGAHTLVSAPTGTGKTLSAFLVFLDRLLAEERSGTLTERLRVVYVSPLKALAGDIRENLRRPLYGIADLAVKAGLPPCSVTTAIRTGDTPSGERVRMAKHPPHILITTPESLYLLLTAKSGREMLKTAEAVIVDELHAMIDSKRGAHLTLSLARLDTLCGKELQRIGLSATIDPPLDAARYLSGGAPVTVVAPKMKKATAISVTSPAENMYSLPHGTIWPELASAVYDRCAEARSAIAFTDGRQFAEKLAYYVNQEAPNPDAPFARTHHGCVSKEQRFQAESDLRSGKLRLLCATSSMELGIDVGEIDRVMQIGCPSSIASVLQRLGRAGHNPGRVSVMDIFPRTAAEGINCGLTARVATDGGVERMKPPRLCLDVLAQHLVSMASVEDGYSIDDALELTSRAIPFREVTREDIEGVLRMLAGDYEHAQDLPVRPRVLYDRINGRVEGDNYSRMLAVSAGGTIPDLGMYAVKTEGGVKLGELDEEFVGEARVGDRFLLGSFAWKITKMDRETVFVSQTTPAGAQPPFWRLAWLSRRLQTGIAFGKLLRNLNEAEDIEKLLDSWLLDEAAVRNTAGVVESQLRQTGGFPDDRTVIAEHFQDEAGEQQLMVHSVFGKQVNAPLALLLQDILKREFRIETSNYPSDDGLLIMASFGGILPDGLLNRLNPETARERLSELLPASSLFNLLFRHNAARALMTGVRKGKRQPLWIQRLRAAEMLDSLVGVPDHPLIRETKRECLEDYWDLDGLEWLLNGFRSGQITVRELHTDFPSPLSLPLRRAAENTLLYEYFPTTGKIQSTELWEEAQKLKPSPEQLARASDRGGKFPEDEKQLHSLLMTEGDLVIGEFPIPGEWLESLEAQGRALYIEPGLWIAAEHQPDYGAALEERDPAALGRLVRRSLRFRGAQTAEQLSDRYFIPVNTVQAVLNTLGTSVIEDNGLFYHADVYERARRETVTARRRQVKTMPPERFAALIAHRLSVSAPPAEQLRRAVGALSGAAFPIPLWEGSILPARVGSYAPGQLDSLLASGEWFWAVNNGDLIFRPASEIDWDADLTDVLDSLERDEKTVFDALLKRGASFGARLAALLPVPSAITEVTLSLVEKGLIHADSFAPVRQLLERDKIKKATPKRRISAQVKLSIEGRFEVTRPLAPPSPLALLERVFDRFTLASYETWKRMGVTIPWSAALAVLRVWEATGQARRGYFVEGLSGAQFVRAGDFDGFQHGLENPPQEPVWLSAADPAQLWGAVLPHLPGRDFALHAGSAVALTSGEPAAVFERSGQVLRVFTEDKLPEALRVFAELYLKKRIYPTKRRLTVKQYPKEAVPALTAAGFSPVMLDFELSR
ncbi:MAG: DEAD/DEAH box helicase [Oscillospiraceae bacterium]|jgi:ATP-dependent Lhr-like helicase|nr:DEAD/DEAH box helicase [Oscillospiraceae bacterium]